MTGVLLKDGTAHPHVVETFSTVTGLSPVFVHVYPYSGGTAVSSMVPVSITFVLKCIEAPASETSGQYRLSIVFSLLSSSVLSAAFRSVKDRLSAKVLDGMTEAGRETDPPAIIHSGHDQMAAMADMTYPGLMFLLKAYSQPSLVRTVIAKVCCTPPEVVMVAVVEPL